MRLASNLPQREVRRVNLPGDMKLNGDRVYLNLPPSPGSWTCSTRVACTGHPWLHGVDLGTFEIANINDAVSLLLGDGPIAANPNENIPKTVCVSA